MLSLLSQASREALEETIRGPGVPFIAFFFKMPALKPQPARIEGELATVTAVPTPRTTPVRLVRENGEWKVDLIGIMQVLVHSVQQGGPPATPEETVRRLGLLLPAAMVFEIVRDKLVPEAFFPLLEAFRALLSENSVQLLEQRREELLTVFYAPLIMPAISSTLEPGEVTVEGDSAVVAAATAPAVLEVKLVKEDGQWKVDLEGMMAGMEELLAPQRAKARVVQTLSNVKQLCTALVVYAADHDQHLPEADKWMDQTTLYTKRQDILRSPAAPELEYGYAFNKALDKMNLKKIRNPSTVVLVFSSKLGTRNAAGGPEAVADPPRFPQGNVYGFCDGHAEIRRDVPNFAPGGAPGLSESLSNVKQIALGLVIRASDYDQNLPQADKWMDQTKAYMKSQDILRCPGAPELEYGYAFNKALDKMNLKKIRNPSTVVLVFSSKLGTRNAAGGPEAVADPPRFPQGNVYAFCDGHAEIRRDVPNFDPTGRRVPVPRAVTAVAEIDFLPEVLQAELPVVVHYWAPRVTPCQQLKPILRELGAQYRGRVKFAAVNIEENPTLTEQQKVTGLPCLVLYREGQEIARQVGLITSGGAPLKQQVREWIEQSLGQ